MMTRSRSTLIGLGLAVSLCGMPNATPITAAETVPQWSVYELTLTATGTYANPATDVAPVLDLTNPDGVTIRVRGFWDGDQTYRFRIIPTSQGIWSYTTAAEPADAGLTSVGTFEAAAPATGAHGLLRRDPKHPERFAFDDGTPFFMWGQTYYEIIRNAMAGDSWKTAIDNSHASGVSKIRFALTTWGDETNPFPDQLPFLENNRDIPNIAYWQKLDEIVRYLHDRQLIADLILFVDSARAFGTHAQDERFVQYAIARYAAYPNVIWCLTNEWEYTEKDKSYWDTLGTLVRQNDPWMTAGASDRPLSIHQKTGRAFHYHQSNWPTYAIVQWGVRNGNYVFGDQWGNHGIVHNLGQNKPVVNDEYGYLGETTPIDLTQKQHRLAMWGIAVAGGYGSVGDATPYDEGVTTARPIISAIWHDNAAYADLKRMTDFWTTKGIRYWQMVNKNSNVSGNGRTYALGSRDAGYVVYSADGGTFTLRLPNPETSACTYQVYLYDPRNGEEIRLPDVRSGGAQRFSLPRGDDWVVYLIPA